MAFSHCQRGTADATSILPPPGVGKLSNQGSGKVCDEWVLTFGADVNRVGHELVVIISVSVQGVLMDHEPHLMSVFDQASGAVLAQVQVETKGGELGGFPTVLADLDLDCVLVTADAYTPGAVSR